LAQDLDPFTVCSSPEYLIDKALVALVPGDEFGAPNHVRFSFATSEENITKGLARIKEALSLLK